MRLDSRAVVWSCALLAAVGCGRTVAAPAAASMPATARGEAGMSTSVAVSAISGHSAPSAGAGSATTGDAGASRAGVTTAGGAGAVAAESGRGASLGASTVAGATAGSGGRTGASMSSAGSGGAGTAGAAGGIANAQSLPAVTDYTKPGPFKTKVESGMGPSNKYTIYRPEPLGESGFVHAPIIFGPGIATSCEPGGALNIYTALLNHFSSHGFVTICVNSLSGGPGDPNNLAAMKMGLEWLIAQNAQAGSYRGKLAVDRAIAMGYSIGAGGAIGLSSHPAVMTTVVIHDHRTQADPRGPVLMITGTMDVIDDMRATFMTLEEAPAVLIALPIGHLDVIGEIAASGRYVAPITAWLRYWVNADQGAKHFFFGADCDVCKSPWIAPEPNAKWRALL